MTTPILEFDHVTKRFPGVTALSDVSFAIAAGQCHALVGENGAGKSTLGKMVAGLHRPDGGMMRFDGRPAGFRGPLAAARAGISIVHQELAFCPNLSIAENLFLGRLPTRGGLVRSRETARQARGMLDEVGLRVDPATPMERLSTGQEQLVQIALAVARGARVVVMDEPTSSLTSGESKRLFEIVERLKRRGVTIVYVSHRMDEIRRLCETATVLRDGRFVRTVAVADTPMDEIVRLMIGRPLSEYFPAHLSSSRGQPVLELQGLSSTSGVVDVSLTVHAGEVVGLAGLVGAGRSELARAIFGVDATTAGTIRLEGRAVRIDSPRAAIRLGIGLLPEDRKRQGLVLSMDCEQNATLPLLDRLRGRVFLRRRRERTIAERFFRRLRVRTPGPEAPVVGLSGGNQQKIALIKWLARRCKVLILDEPTRGVDVAAKAEIHGLIDRLAAAGHAILLISSELPEVIHLSTRIVVMAGGRLVGELPRAQATQESVMRLMAQVDRDKTGQALSRSEEA